MDKLKFVLFLALTGTIFFSCKREDTEVIGPELAIASPDFKILDNFDTNVDNINFATDSLWFTATFNERVSWKITITGMQSKAIKEMSGISNVLNKSTAIWSGTQSDLYFFKAGEDVTAELTIIGLKNEKWTTTATITGEKKDYGSDVIVWWDMHQIGDAKHGFVYWFDFYDGDPQPPDDPRPPAPGIGERLLEKIENSPRTDNNPVQGIYRSIEGKDGLGASNYYVGGLGHSPLPSQKGFISPMKDIYLNFYLRKRTPTTSLSVGLISSNGGNSRISYNVGEITWEGWRLISIKLSDMVLEAGNPAFDPSKLIHFFANLQIVSAPGIDQTGFDIDFITITKGGPFDPSKYK